MASLEILLFAIGTALAIPASPKAGPPGAILKYDLLSNSQPGLNYPGQHLGAFVPQTWPAGQVNHELQEYLPENASQDGGSGEITITARKDGNRITSARLETYKVWSTAQSNEIKYRGYLEVESTLPIKTNGGNFRGSWPAIWMLGSGNGWEWPRHGEIDIMEAVNGEPKIVMSLHSTNFFGGGPQHPPANPYIIDANLDETPLVAGFEWNVQDNQGQIDLTWWTSWFDLGSNSWQSAHTTKSLFKNGNNDYYDFFNSFNTEGFSLLINLAQGGDFPQVFNPGECFIDGQPQYMRIKSVKVYGF